MYIFKTPLVFRWIFPRKVWGVSSSNKVYLTFDDGPTESLTNWILEELEKNNIKATFFCVGENAKQHTGLMESIINGGHAIGNHTMRHENGNKTSKADYLSSIEEAASYTSKTLFRPPYGRLPISYVKSIRKQYKIVMWSWLSYDYDKKISVDKIISKAKKIKAGDILVVHDNLKVEERLKVILPQIIAIVKEKGLEFETVPSSMSSKVQNSQSKII